MSSISPIRLAASPDISQMLSAAGSTAGARAASGPGGVSAAQFEKLAAALEAQPNRVDSSSAAGGLGADFSAPGSEFANVLTQMVREVSAKQAAAGDAMSGVLSGQGIPLHEAVIAGEEASLSFQLMVEVRNKLLESYQELMRMQV
ncbi:MAG: flagellar hook-basal body complex protein FliE [Verrucomicrobia bacterium]|nr:flagellar hook-basal body complex protein FliE [Verrucomicrobiota bacterium]MBI3870333.1 flagellar hook-basal body complex protein FliE [Verrucomicrobiota bacterium]